NRSTADHLLTLNAVLDYNKYLKSETYIWFGDAIKCFDKLCLKDCIFEFGKVAGWEEAELVYKINEIGKAIIETPVGLTKEIEIAGKVKQGTILGPKLCSIVTDKVNTIGRKNITLIRNIEIESLIYVDDIMFPSSRKDGIEKAIDNCHSLELLKKFKFNTKPEKSGVLSYGKGKRKESNEIQAKVKNGIIQPVQNYKYLGEWYSEEGNHKLSLSKKREKTEFMIQEILKYGDNNKVGKMALEVRLKIYETVVVPTLFANVETWSTITEKEMDELENIQYKVLKRVMEQVTTTPYWGIIAETGVWPVVNRVEYKKIMLYHNIATSENKRLVKEIVEDQISRPYGYCWGKSIKDICSKYDIKIEEIKSYTKCVLKKEIKRKIAKEINTRIVEKTWEMKKLRFLEEWKKQDYLTELNTWQAIMTMKIRLNMLKTKCNYKNKDQENLLCGLCKEKDDTTEHLVECRELGKLSEKKFSAQDIKSPTKEFINYIEKAMKIKDLSK
ncbi:MAG: reverse transcriptase domain-containing protein, partial [Cyanobacteria bacterium J06614_10]